MTRSARYLIQRTQVTGHWRTLYWARTRREALATGRYLAAERVHGRRRVTVRVVATHSGIWIAGWINGWAAWGEAFPK